MPIKIALPKGRLLKPTAALLQKAGWELDEYHARLSFYHPQSRRFPDLRIKVFQDKDIPIQVAIGNYDLGICGLDWIEELLVKYPSSAVVKLRDLGYGQGSLCVAGEMAGGNNGNVRIASEYPNLAEAYALRARLRRFSVFPVWGAAESYPPENAELALVPETAGLKPLSRVLEYSAFLIANKNSWVAQDLGAVVGSICGESCGAEPTPAAAFTVSPPVAVAHSRRGDAGKDLLRLALPDGHQQEPTRELLAKSGILVEDYPSATGNRRPGSNLDGVAVKVIRPQDMPLQVANGNFDLAVTGRDWLREHLNQFPASPVREVLGLKFGWVRIVAVVSQTLPAEDVASLRKLSAGGSAPLRIASEYVHIADKYARDNQLGNYRIVPTWGATEAFLPEDADLLIENTQTGKTIARHNLRIIDDLFESTACLVARTGEVASPLKKRRMDSLVAALRRATEDE